MQKQVSMGLNMYNQQTYVTKEAHELLFDGYEEDLINMANEMSKYGAFALDIPYDRFGWMYGVSLRQSIWKIKIKYIINSVK